MKMSRLYMPTLREVPSEAELPSHQLLLRAGMIRKLVSGVYSYLPLGYRTFKKVENIVREEMDKSGSQEVLMSAIQPAELWEESGRWDALGPEMFRLHDRHGRQFCLGPTHEEIFTDLIRYEVKSYKQLPLNLYQIQAKYRDEKRPRFGLIRSREFIMKDAYSFDRDEEGMKASYKEMWDAYDKMFTRCGLKFKVVEGDAGAMGDNDSHEFMAMSEYGESLIAYCDSCSYAATDEKAHFSYTPSNTEEAEKELKKTHTPGVKTIEELAEFFKLDKSRFGKMVIYKVKDEPVAVMVPGDRELNETKLINYLGALEHEIEMADEEMVKEITSSETGFAGPINLKEGTRLVVDSRITQMKNFIAGANETNYHVENVNYKRDFEAEIAEDLLLVEAGDRCPECGAELKTDRGIEVGNIFQLATKYSKPLKAEYLDENGKSQLMWMGSYGVGISRTMAAIIEQNHDENGMVWPLQVAPYHAVITVLDVKKKDQLEIGEKLYEEFKARGIEVVLDDRKERPGVKFKDSELIGFPVRVTSGRGVKDGIVEIFERKTGEKTEATIEEALEKVLEIFKNQGFEI